jgi:hypothetical protein
MPTAIIQERKLFQNITILRANEYPWANKVPLIPLSSDEVRDVQGDMSVDNVIISPISLVWYHALDVGETLKLYLIVFFFQIHWRFLFLFFLSLHSIWKSAVSCSQSWQNHYGQYHCPHAQHLFFGPGCFFCGCSGFWFSHWSCLLEWLIGG